MCEYAQIFRAPTAWAGGASSRGGSVAASWATCCSWSTRTATRVASCSRSGSACQTRRPRTRRQRARVPTHNSRRCGDASTATDQASSRMHKVLYPTLPHSAALFCSILLYSALPCSTLFCPALLCSAAPLCVHARTHVRARSSTRVTRVDHRCRDGQHNQRRAWHHGIR